MPEWLQLILTELGGGLYAVALVAMGAVIVALYRRINALTDARIQDIKDYAEARAVTHTETIRTLDALTHALGGGK